MTPERWQQIERLYHAALARDGSERGAFLASACEGDELLQREVESLLAQPVSADSPLDGAAGALVSDVAVRLAPGTRIGVYAVLGLLGKGGMGEVYRAIDTDLKRQVALKVLPAPVASDSERVARFQREAEVLASLNHPNIAAVYGLERANGAAALVMEFVDGPTLADRVARGPLPLDQALAIAVQVADALEDAHERGIVHRDLKPANIKVRPDGAVKLLDFGLAKALEPPAHSYDPQLPTITSPALLTGTGMILGTAAYMAPEQARGGPVTKRADIWAFGCVLYELLTGRRAFAGATVAETLSAVLLKEPDWTLLPRETPAAVLRLLKRALQKPERQRLTDAASIRLELEDVMAGHDAASPASTAPGSAPAARVMGRFLGLAALSVVLAAAVVYLTSRPATPPMRLEFALLPPEGTTFASAAEGGAPAVSPDGRTIAYVAERKGTRELWMQTLGASDARPLPATEGAASPFWSPDGQIIGYIDAVRGRLKKVALTGGAAVDLADAQISAATTSAAWSPDGRILFYGRNNVLYTISASGGEPVQATERHFDEYDENHYLPWFLPDGRHYLMLVRGGADLDFSLFVGELGSNSRKFLVSGVTNAQYVPAPDAGPGRLLFVRQGNLLARPFDPVALAFVGEAVMVAERVAVSGFGSLGDFAVSPGGNLVYRRSTDERAELVWFNRSGTRNDAIGERPGNPMANVRLAPDGRRVAFTRRGDTAHDVWVSDLATRRMTRVTFDGGRTPVWSPDSAQIAFLRGDTVYRKAADGTGVETPVWKGSGLMSVNDWSGDGRFLLLTRWNAEAGLEGRGVWLLESPTARPEDREPVFLESGVHPQFVPADGPPRWVSYDNGDVFVRSMPGAPHARLQITSDGANGSRWRRDGREVFYSSPRYGSLMSLAVDAPSDLTRNAPTTLFPLPRAIATAIGQYSLGYDVTSTGDRFLVTFPSADVPSPAITIVFNWLSGVER